MKKILGVFIAIIAISLLILKIFGNYNTNNVMSNQASFEIFMDQSSLDIDEYFNFPKGTFDKENHIILCKPPVETEGFKPVYLGVKNDLANIDCNENFEEGKHIKYEPYELNGSSAFEFVIVNKFTNLITLNTPIGQSKIIAKKVEYYNYSKGKINRIVFAGNGLYEFCK